jgi:hypothetical protein
VLNLLEDESSRCATCRADIVRDRISFLGEAADDGHATTHPNPERKVDKAEVHAKINRFSLTENDLRVAAAHDSPTPRRGWEPLPKLDTRDKSISNESSPVILG